MKSDVVIVGGGPGGTAAAMFLVRQGIRPTIVEQARFPRYHIGESLTGAGGQVLRDLGLEGAMYERGYPAKQGVKVYGPSAKSTWFVPVTGRDVNWKMFPCDTWQVRRSEFDKMMLDEAVARGTTLIPGRATRPILTEDGSVRGVHVHMADSDIVERIDSEVVLDCSGQATWLANLGVTGPKYLGAYDRQIAIFSQVARAHRDNGPTRDAHPANTLIFYQKKHHWAWFIPLNDDVVSVGIVVPASYFTEKHESREAFFLRELHQAHPELKRRVPAVELVEDVHVIPNYSYQVKRFCGKGFICIGDAHRFIDPIFSFGVTVSMREAQLAAPVVAAYLAGAGRDRPNPFAEHQLFCEVGTDVLEDALDSFWQHPMAFAYSVHVRHTEDLTDILAGRLYERQPSPALHEFRALLGREGQREASYESDDLYSVPIGSRYHPERAPIWDVKAVVETTEAWMGPR